MAWGYLLTGILAAALCSAAFAEEPWDLPQETAVDLGDANLKNYEPQSANQEANYNNDPQGVMSASWEELPPIDDGDGSIPDDDPQDEDETPQHAAQVSTQQNQPQQPTQAAVQKHQPSSPAPDFHTSNVAQGSVWPHRGGAYADSQEQDEAVQDPSLDAYQDEDNASQSSVRVQQKTSMDELKETEEDATDEEESDDDTGDKFLEVTSKGSSFRYEKPKEEKHKKTFKETSKTQKKEHKLSKEESTELPEPLAGKPEDAVVANASDTAQGVPFMLRQKVVGSTPTGPISMGTPPVEMGMILDTGSDKLVVKTWLTLMKSIEKIDVDAASFVNPTTKIYDHNASKTYHAMYSNSSSGKQVPKQGFIAYGSGMAYTAEGEDTVELDQTSIKNFPISEISADSLQVLHSTKGVSGILGLQHMKNRSLGESLFSKMRDQGQMTAFGYCRGDNDDGTFLWGDTSKEGEKLDVVGVMHWAVPLSSFKKHDHKGVSEKDSKKKLDLSSVLDLPKHNSVDLEDVVNTKQLDNLDDKLSNLLRGEGDDSNGYMGGLLDPLEKLKEIIEKLRHKHHGSRNSGSADDSASGAADDSARYEEPKKVEFNGACKQEGDCVAVIDTGSNIIAMPSLVAAALRESLNVSRDCSNLAELPELHFKLGENFSVRLPGEAYVMKVKIPGLPGIDNEKEASSGSSSQEESSKNSSSGRASDKESNALERSSSLEASNSKSVTRKKGDGLSDLWDQLDGDLNPKDGPGIAEQPDYAGLVQQDSSASSTYRARVAKLKSMLQETLDNHGVDLRSMFPGQGIGEMLKMFSKPTTLCMPAIAAVDMNTTKGSLWVVGTPLFEKYYTRWSWAKGDESPKIFVKEKSKAEACQGKDQSEEKKTAEKKHEDPAPRSEKITEKESDKMVVIRDQGHKPVPVMRSENHAQLKPKGKAEALQEVSVEPQEIDLKDIRYPHWAKGLEFL